MLTEKQILTLTRAKNQAGLTDFEVVKFAPTYELKRRKWKDNAHFVITDAFYSYDGRKIYYTQAEYAVADVEKGYLFAEKTKHYAYRTTEAPVVKTAKRLIDYILECENNPV